MKKSKTIILFITLLIALLFFFIGCNSFNNEEEKIGKKRMLLNHYETNKICNKATNSFKEKYSLINTVKKEEIKRDDNDERFIDFLKNESLTNISKYSKYLFMRYFIFIGIDIILIFFWFSYCYCCCSPCCCCAGEQGCCSKISYGVSILMMIGLIALGIVGLVFGYPLKNNIVEAGCSGFKLFDHFEYGLENDYKDFSDKWIGLNQIYNLLKDSEEIYGLIENYNFDETKCQTKPTDDPECTILKNGNAAIQPMKTSSVNDLKTIEDSKKTMDKFRDGLDEIENKYLDDVYTYLDDYIIKYSILYIFLFVLVLAFGLIGLIFLTAYAKTCDCCKCFYIVLWNIESLFIIIIVLIGVTFGLIYCISKNIISAVDYSIQSKNLEDSNSIFFNEEIKEYVNICFNGNGIINEISQFNNSIYNNFQNIINIKDDSITYTPSPELKEDLESLNNIINKADGLLKKYNINENNMLSGVMNCTFMKSDINIFINEVNYNLMKTSKRLEIIIYVVALCASISIICGIIVTNRYKKTSEDLNGTKIEEKQHFETERKGINEKN